MNFEQKMMTMEAEKLATKANLKLAELREYVANERFPNAGYIMQATMEWQMAVARMETAKTALAHIESACAPTTT